ncbi:MAG: hypothetical protein HYY06_25560 [Deltaproteobacteria bacterium]|nr:hypothetical protein [Deltaproteobacteria bacterium]
MAAGALETFEPSGEALSVPGLLPPPRQGRPYQPIALEWAVIGALLEATPGVRVREHVGFYPPRPINLAGRPAPFTFGHVAPLSRVGWWRAAENAQFLIVPYHHDDKSLAFYAPAGEGQVRFVTRLDARCSEQERAVEGSMLTRQGDQVQVINLCGRVGAELVVFRAHDGRLACSRQPIDPAAVVPPDPENGDDL